VSIIAIAKSILSPILGIVDKAVKDKDLAAQLKNDLQVTGLELIAAELDAQKSIIVAEANSESWLARNWRPLTMITFVVLIVMHWLGLTDKTITEVQSVELLGLIKVGLGGYVVGRSAEKVAKVWSEK
jgi:hypothetical protein